MIWDPSQNKLITIKAEKSKIIHVCLTNRGCSPSLFLDNNREVIVAFQTVVLLERSCKSSLVADRIRNLLSIKYVSKRMELRDLKEKKMLFRR